MKIQYKNLENYLQQLVKFAIKSDKNYTKGVRVNLAANGKGIIHLEFSGGGAYTKSSIGISKQDMKEVSNGHHYSSVGQLINSLEKMKLENVSILSIEYFDVV